MSQRKKTIRFHIGSIKKKNPPFWPTVYEQTELAQEGQEKALEPCSANYHRHYGGLDCHTNFHFTSIWYLTPKLLICNGVVTLFFSVYEICSSAIYCGSHVFTMAAECGNCKSPTYLKTFSVISLNPKPTVWHWNHGCRSLNFRDIQMYMYGVHVFQDGRQICYI